MIDPKGKWSAQTQWRCRSAAADEFAAAYQSECRPGGPYGALKIVPLRLDEDQGAEQDHPILDRAA